MANNYVLKNCILQARHQVGRGDSVDPPFCWRLDVFFKPPSPQSGDGPILKLSQQTWDVGPTLGYCWPTVYNVVPTVNQRWPNVQILVHVRLWLPYRTDPSVFYPCFSWASGNDIRVFVIICMISVIHILINLIIYITIASDPDQNPVSVLNKRILFSFTL